MRKHNFYFAIMYGLLFLVADIIQSAAFHKDIPYEWWMGYAGNFFACCSICVLFMWLDPHRKPLQVFLGVGLLIFSELFELTGHTIGGMIIGREVQGITFDPLDIVTYILSGIFVYNIHVRREGILSPFFIDSPCSHTHYKTSLVRQKA